MKEDEARQRDARVSMSLSVDTVVTIAHSTIRRRSARPLHWQSGCDSALPAKAHLDKQYKLWSGSRAESCWLHDIPVAVQNEARLDSATDAAWFISQAWRLREVRSCSARSVACSFPPPLPTEYLFLEGGQPLNHKISVRHHTITMCSLPCSLGTIKTALFTTAYSTRHAQLLPTIVTMVT
jgi:hypothetical protein